MKYVHGQYMPIMWDCNDDHPEYVRGHVNEAEATAALEAWERGSGAGEHTLRHCYGRWVFSDSYEFDRELKVYDVQSRGAFAMTEVRPNTCIDR